MKYKIKPLVIELVIRSHVAMRQWVKEREDEKLPIVTHRIGINFGTCVVGNIEKEDLKGFTVVGDLVNVANRMCDICKELKCDFLSLKVSKID